MKVHACLVLLLAAASQAGFFSKVGDFFSNLAKNFGHSALDHITHTGVSLAKNITSNTANMLAETGQMAMFELGNIANKGNGRRDTSQLVGKLEAALQADVQKVVGAVTKDAEVVSTSCRQILQALLQGKLTPQAVIDFLPEVQGAIARVSGEAQHGMMAKVLQKLHYRGGKELHQEIKAKLIKVLEPLSQSIHKELGSLASGLEHVAILLLQNDVKGVAKALMDMA